MSDSDDTDILLLIPPNFFLTETHLNDSPNYEMFRTNLEHRPIKPILSPRKSAEKPTTQSMNVLLSHSKDLLSTPPQLKYRPYYDTSPTVNISNFNRSFERLNCIGLNDVSNAACNIESDKAMAHRRSSSPLGRTLKSNTAYLNKEYSTERIGNLSSRRMSDWKTNTEDTRNPDDNLIGLNNVWNDNLDFKAAPTAAYSTELEEERLKRRQCERNISLLQSQLNHYQSKFSDVIKMDQAKNDTLSKLHSTNSRWGFFS